MRFKIRGVGMMDALKSSLSVLALLYFCLVGWTAAAQAELTFQTLDGGMQQINSEEIWRIRATYASDEPPGAVVIDYAFERVYVKDSLHRCEQGGRRTAFKEIYPARRSASLHRCHQGDRRHRAIPHRLTPMPRVQETPEAINETLAK